MNGSTSSGGLRRGLGHAREIVAYSLFPILGIVTPLLAYPVLSSHFGATGWASVAVGQSVGAAASVAVELGWALTGPQALPGLTPAGQRSLFVVSLKSRLLVAAVAVPGVVAIVYGLAPTYALAGALSGAALCLSGLSANWYFIGLGKPFRIFLTDALPRMLSVLGAVLALLAGADLWVFSAIVLAGYLVSPTAACFLIGARPSEFSSARAAPGVLREQFLVVVGRGASALYIGLPAAILQAVAPPTVAPFAAVDRLLRMGLLVLQAVPNSLQRLLGSARGTPRLRRVSRAALAMQAGVGVLAALTCFVAVGPVSAVLFSSTVDITWTLAFGAALIALFTSLSRGTGLVLVALDRVRWIVRSAVLAAVTALGLIVPLAERWGASGAEFALAAAEVVALSVQVVGLWGFEKRITSE